MPAQWARWVPPWLTSILVGAAFCLLALVLREAVQTAWPTVVPFGFLFPMILLATLVGRWLGGLTCFALGGLVIWFMVRPQLEDAGLPQANNTAVVVLYVFAAGTMLLIAEFYRRGQEALRREQTLRAEGEAERQRLLTQELGHRIKNLLSTVQAIATQSLDGAGVNETARRTLQDRLVALARAHNLLTDAAWAAVPLDQLVSASVAAFEDGQRFQIGGPTILLPPRQTVAMALALHELATNALKYGALSSADGRIDINWQQDGADLRFSWIEQGGPPVEMPQRTGFGTRLLQRNLATELEGKVVLDYAAAGLRCEILAPALRQDTASHPQQLNVG